MRVFPRRLRPIYAGMLVVVVAALGNFYLATYLRGLWVALRLRRPVQDWLMNHGLDGLVMHASLLYLQIPHMALNVLGGMVVGAWRPRQWVSLSLLYTVAYIAAGWFFGLFYGLLDMLRVTTLADSCLRAVVERCMHPMCPGGGVGRLAASATA